MSLIIGSEQISITEDKYTRDKAKAMFMRDDILPTEIADYLDIDINELRNHVFGKDLSGKSRSCWEHQKRMLLDSGKPKQTSAMSYVRTKSFLVTRAEADMIELVTKSINDMKENGDIFETVDDIRKAISTISELDKIVRLNEGEATEHIQVTHSGLTIRDILDEANKNKDNDFNKVIIN